MALPHFTFTHIMDSSEMIHGLFVSMVIIAKLFSVLGAVLVSHSPKLEPHLQPMLCFTNQNKT